MRAAVVNRYGGPESVEVREVADPVPTRSQLLVRVEAAAVTSGDARIRAARFPKGFTVPARLVFGVTRPRRRVLGSMFAGVVEAAGSATEGFSIGDAVCGSTGTRMGAHAELVATPTTRLVPIPAGVGFDDAAGVLFGGSTALGFLRDKGAVQPGMSVLVVGASGAVGTNAVQLARHLGARVTGVTSTANVRLVEALGAERVIDYTRQPLDAIGERFDLVLDTVGVLSIDSGRRLLVPGGKVALAVATLGETLRARGDVIAGPAPERAVDFALLLDLVARGELRVVHDRAVALGAIAEAHARVDTGRKVGNVLVHPQT